MAATPRKRLVRSAAVLAGAVMVAVPLTAASASAAVNRPPQVQELTFYDDYWSQNECESVGRAGVDKGMWKVYECRESAWDWDLYVGR
ncbi:hypothetical protein [Streptomyces sp. NPDC052114]|uniref:hypothetical protein n=1 Tax=unclassified Streptomyces TaxID=2593676 RepID=UPI0034240A84